MAKHNKKNDQTVPPVQSSADETQQLNIDKLLQMVQLLISQQLQSSKGAQSQSPSHLNVKFNQFNDEDETFANFVNCFEIITSSPDSWPLEKLECSLMH